MIHVFSENTLKDILLFNKKSSYSFKAVINVHDEQSLLFTSPIPYFWFPIDETYYWNYSPFYGSLKIYEKYENIAIHCAAGANRSPSVAYALINVFSLENKYEEKVLKFFKKIFEINIKNKKIPSDIINFLKYCKENKNASIAAARYNLLKS